MNKKLIYTISIISCLMFGFVGFSFMNTLKVQEKAIAPKQELAKASPEMKKKRADKPKMLPENVSNKTFNQKSESGKIIVKSKHLDLAKISFDNLPGWDTADLKKSLLAFQNSCQTFLKQSVSHKTGSQLITIKAGDWHPVCRAALDLKTADEDLAKTFFEKWFHPIEFKIKSPSKSLFTGYYMPQIQGNLTQTAYYNTPIYGLPKSGNVPSYTRAEIDNGALAKKVPVIAWIHSPAERLFLEIEGSGVIKLPDGTNVYVGYAAENGAPYTSIAKVMINQGIMTPHTASKKAIMRYLNQHPEKAKTIIQKNRSFVFFERLEKPQTKGAHSTSLTPGYSLAVDRRWIPMGAPLWLNTTHPDKNRASDKQLQRLMIAQDTGGAIRGFMRGDIYWGSGKLAAFLGEHMKNQGHYWLLLPKHILNRVGKQK